MRERFQRPSLRRTWKPVAAAAAVLTLVSGCARPSDPPAIRVGVECAACGMSIQDLRFACERRVDRGWRTYDSIECLLRETQAGNNAWLADYDTKTLHAADSMWIVRGEFPSPMGGGLAAFLDRAAAEEIAARTNGKVSRFGGADAAGSEGTS